MINTSNSIYYIPKLTKEEKDYFKQQELIRRQIVYNNFPEEIKTILRIIDFTTNLNYGKHYWLEFPTEVYIKTSDGKFRKDIIEETVFTHTLVDPCYPKLNIVDKYNFDNMFKFGKSHKKLTFAGYKKFWAFDKEDFE